MDHIEIILDEEKGKDKMELILEIGCGVFLGHLLINLLAFIIMMMIPMHRW